MTYKEILYEKKEGVAKIAINRPEKLNAFTPRTLFEMGDALLEAWADKEVGVVVLTGVGNRAFCVGGDQSIRDVSGYRAEDMAGMRPGLGLMAGGLSPHELIRKIPKVVIAMVNGYAIGGGHVIHIICDLTIASETARFGQAGPRVGSFDAGFGSAYLARVVGQKKAREIWFLCRQYSAQEALEMGLVNKVVPPDKLEAETMAWAREIMALSPTAIATLKASFNADVDSIAGIGEMSGKILQLFTTTDEAQEGIKAFLEKRKPDFSPYR